MFCFTCRRLSPSTARHCGYCGRSFRGRYCRHGHLSPRWSRRCIECGDTHLTAPTAYLSLGWVYRAISWLVVLLLVRWVFFHGTLVGSGLSESAHWTLAHVFGVEPAAVAAWVSHALSTLIFLCIVLAALPGRFGQRIRYIAVSIGRSLFGLIVYTVPKCGRCLGRVVGVILSRHGGRS